MIRPKQSVATPFPPLSVNATLLREPGYGQGTSKAGLRTRRRRGGAIPSLLGMLFVRYNRLEAYLEKEVV